MVLGFMALMMWLDARDAREAASVPAGHENHEAALPLASFAGQVPENAE